MHQEIKWASKPVQSVNEDRENQYGALTKDTSAGLPLMYPSPSGEVMSSNPNALGMNEVQLYTILHFGGDIARPKIGSIVSYVGGSTKLTSLRAHSSYEDFVILLEEISKICHKDWKLYKFVYGCACAISSVQDFTVIINMHKTNLSTPFHIWIVNELRVPSENSQNFISNFCSSGKGLSTTKDTGSETEGENTYKAASSRWVASIIKQKLQKGPNYKPSGIIDDMQIYHNIDVTYNLTGCAKEKAYAEMRGSFEHAYQLLTSYFTKVRLVDPDSVSDIQTASCKNKRFTRCFWYFGPPKKTYKLLRPVVVIGGTFLKGKYRGTLLTAIAIDPSNHIFPLAFSIIDSETTESWTYFLEMFGPNFHGYDTRFVVISDRNPGIINVVPKVFPFAIHTFCVFHILNNIKITLENMRITFRMVAEALTSIDFDKHMNVIQNTDPVGLQYILGIPKETWSNLYILMSRYGVAYTNHVESWNNVILKVRYLPIHVFIEKLRRICLEIYYTYREEAEKSQACLTP
ncbi:hypothetical protein GIB67_027657 [Kingdonia uniflora]|uniref:MULE transposase domain-containing protein n=1 Tax=Kingdonia uniflora TaxID=39325 RepID=A0A7J7NKW1_9MAGN|nr:hypothetical protein GIB67_027657 [Kingdonia uniflora]